MPTLQEYIIAASNFDEDFLSQIPTDEDFLSRDAKPEDLALSAYLILQASIGDTFRMVLEIFEDMNDNDTLHIMNQILMDERTSANILLKLRDYYPELSPIELISQWEDQAYSDRVITAIDKVIRIFGIPNYEVLKPLLTELENKEQADLYNYLFNLASEVSDYAPIPDWIIKDHVVTNEELEHKLLSLEHPNIKIEPHKLSSDIYQLLTPFSDISLNQIENDLSRSSEQDLQTLVSIISNIQTEKALEEDNKLISYFGPSNPIQYPLSGKYEDHGLDRMFLCDLFDHDPITGEDIDYFEGSCDKCALRIRKRHHCVRMPIPNGGWEGCFCSWKCTSEYANDKYYLDGPFIDNLISLYEKQINTYGIYERE